MAHARHYLPLRKRWWMPPSPTFGNFQFRNLRNHASKLPRSAVSENFERVAGILWHKFVDFSSEISPKSANRSTAFRTSHSFTPTQVKKFANFKSSDKPCFLAKVRANSAKVFRIFGGQILELARVGNLGNIFIKRTSLVDFFLQPSKNKHRWKFVPESLQVRSKFRIFHSNFWRSQSVFQQTNSRHKAPK